MQAVDVEWNATGGRIDKSGVFTAGKDEGSFLVKAQVGKVTGSANITVAKGETVKQPVSPGVQKLTWSGEIAPQKWTNFYMKVLTKLVSAGDLKLRVEIEAMLKDGASDQKVEEIKAALRGLGMDDDVETQ